MKPWIWVQLFASPIVNLLSLCKMLVTTPSSYQSVCFVEVDLKSEVDCTSCKLNKKGNVSLRDRN